MRARLISAAVLVPVVVALFLLGPPWLTLGIALVAALAAYETVQLVRQAGLPSSLWLPVIASPLAVLLMAWSVEPTSELHFALVAPGVAVVVILAAILSFRHSDMADGLRAWLGTLFATAYPALLAFLAAYVGLGPQPQSDLFFGIHIDSGRILLLLVVLTVWTTDTGAYLTGRTYPKGRMAPHISPNKTWSGAIGGTVAAIVVGAALGWGSSLGPVLGASIGLVVAITGQAGDLAESVLKRAAGAKDSGRLIPGHGGVLDRVDSFLFAGPAVYALLVVYAGLAATELL